MEVFSVREADSSGMGRIQVETLTEKMMTSHWILIGPYIYELTRFVYCLHTLLAPMFIILTVYITFQIPCIHRQKNGMIILVSLGSSLSHLSIS